MKKLVLFGDSLFGQVSKSELQLLEQKLNGQYDVYNCATGGWNTDDLVQKASYIAQLKPNVLVLSVGTNDAAPWKQLDIDKFSASLPLILNKFSGSKIIFFLPPPVNEERRPEDKKFPNDTLKKYSDAARQICENNNVQYINSWEVFRSKIESDDSFHVDDGVHISEEGYGMLFDEIKRVLAV